MKEKGMVAAAMGTLVSQILGNGGELPTRWLRNQDS